MLRDKCPCAMVELTCVAVVAIMDTSYTQMASSASYDIHLYGYISTFLNIAQLWTILDRICHWLSFGQRTSFLSRNISVQWWNSGTAYLSYCINFLLNIASLWPISDRIDFGQRFLKSFLFIYFFYEPHFLY